MFERFTASARAVLTTAQQEARGLNHNFIGTEHIALGVVQCGDSVITNVLAGYDFSVQDLRDRISEIVGEGAGEVDSLPPFTPRAKKVLELSLREALAMGHDHIGPAHVLLGILREGDGVGALVLGEYGVEYDRVRLWAAQLLGEREPRRRGRGRGRRRDFVAEAEAMLGTPPTMRLPGKAAELAGPDRPGTQHYLLALLEDPDSLAAKVLADLGVTKAQVEAKIAGIGVEGTSDAPPARVPPPARVTLAEGVEVRISDPDLAKLVESGHVEELLKEIVRRSKPPA